MTQTVEQLLRDDVRPPIVYLRSFNEEEQESKYGRSLRRTFFGRLVGGSGSAAYLEEQKEFGVYMRWVGPYIAITRPGEKSVSGAVRLEVSDRHWKSVVKKLLKKAGFVVVRLGGTPGLTWEIKEVIRMIRPTVILLITPGNKQEYKMLCQHMTSFFPHGLPTRMPNSRLLTFDERWHATPLKPRANLIESLAPFFRWNGVDFPVNSVEAFIRQKKRGYVIKPPG